MTEVEKIQQCYNLDRHNGVIKDVNRFKKFGFSSEPPAQKYELIKLKFFLFRNSFVKLGFKLSLELGFILGLKT